MANITRKGEPREALAGSWDPLRAFDPFRLVRDLMGADPFAGTVQARSETFAPDLELKESKSGYEITADLPGVREQDVDISITGNRLTLSGKREEEMEREEGDRYYVYERSYGSFSRSFTLPEGADFDHVKAELRDGVLHLSIPKKTEVQSRRIEVSKGAGPVELSGSLPEQKQEQKKPGEKKGM